MKTKFTIFWSESILFIEVKKKIKSTGRTAYLLLNHDM